MRLEPEERCRNDTADNDEERHGFVLEEYLSEHEHRERGQTDPGGRGVRFAQMPEKVAAVLPEIPVRAVEAEELRELRAREEKGDAALETDHHAFGDEIHDGARPDEPREKRDETDEQRGCRGERAETRRVAARDAAE